MDNSPRKYPRKIQNMIWVWTSYKPKSSLEYHEIGYNTENIGHWVPWLVSHWSYVALVRCLLTKFYPFSSDSALLESEEPSRNHNIAWGGKGWNSRPPYTSSATHIWLFRTPRLFLTNYYSFESFFYFWTDQKELFYASWGRLYIRIGCWNVIKLGLWLNYITIFASYSYGASKLLAMHLYK